MAITSPRAGQFRFETLPTGFFGDEKLTDWQIREWLTRVAVVVNGTMEGKINATGDVTLTASSTTTTLADLRIGPNSIILFMPKTANAAAAMTALHVSARGKQTATLTHDNTADVDRTFGYAVFG